MNSRQDDDFAVVLPDARISGSAIPNQKSEIVNILLVDDHSENLLALEATLDEMDLNIFMAQSGREALRYCLNQDFAVILLDVQMPEMDGFETAALIRERERSQHTPIIFLTAFGKSEEQVFRGYSVGAVDYIFKPFVPEILKAKVEVFVDLFKKTKELKQKSEQLAMANQKLEQQLLEIGQLNRNLEAANKELEAFSYSVSHDLRAPLRSIGGFSQALLEDYPDKLDDTGKDYLRCVRAATQRMGELIEDLLKLSRVAMAEIYREPVNLSALAEGIVAILKKTQPARHVEFVIAPGVMATGDERLLRITLENLLGNAWKFTSKNPHARIEFGIAQHENNLIYFVRDNGIGFDMAYADKLFSAFQRLHSANEFPGTGIGLATVARIIHRHRGHVWAEAHAGKGATFYFTI